ncbi:MULTISPECIES: hypothetical protein [Streptomyces]|uniref:hypothetical protein n=1 Tax=Streptomyces TaxID=1883 RepID=UPI001F40F00E|nr:MULTISPECIES: hypothetical protein [Streptomyces]
MPDPAVRQVGWHRGETTQDEEEAAPFGIPKEIILLTGQDVWPYTFIADDSGGGCGKVPVPADAASEEVQTAIFTHLADLTRIFRGVEIDVEWSSLTPDSWVGHIRRVTAEEPAPPGAVPKVG